MPAEPEKQTLLVEGVTEDCSLPLTLPRPRPRRYRLIAPVELTNLDSDMQLKAVVSDLNLFGCHVSARETWTTGTRVRIRIAHKGSTFAALAKIVYALPTGMGVAFTHIDPSHESILENWVVSLRHKG